MKVVLLLLATTIFVSPVFAQGFSVESKGDPSVVGAGPFVSLEGRFSIALPKQISGFRPLALDSPAGRMRGDAYNWTMKEGNYIAGFVDSPQSMENPDSIARLFAGIRDGLAAWATSKGGKLAGERQMMFDKHPGLEMKLEFPERVLWQRFFVVSNRVYEVLLNLTTDQRPNEAVAVKVLDSFKILSEAEVSAALKAEAAAAEPAPLPQEPVVARVGSDAADDSLRGAVKTVAEYVEDWTGTWSTQGRKPSSTKAYNKGGNLTRAEQYDYKGNLSSITVYGYLDGARVSSDKSIERNYNPPPIVSRAAPGAVEKKSDSRYSNKFTYRYDEQKRLIEKTVFFNNGDTAYRSVYKYSANQSEYLSYSREGALNQRFLYTLDDKGNEVEKTEFKASDGSVREKYSYAYEFDAQGNWIKRVVSKWVTKDGKSYFAPQYAEYRTITYY
ncbi:MAG TPA: hypothetical protein VFI24_11540 [Pyrinomonadaceae bacterium]|nr:hypothetical protein [Pyrinomonadaceae bacterium]